MTIQQLQYVLEISRTGSVSKAAKSLFVSQPNISSAIKNLEEELGVTIFQRAPSGMQLTTAGRRLVERAGSIMGSINEIAKDLGQEEACLFRMAYPRYVPAFEAFGDLCAKYQHSAYVQLSCFIGEGELPLQQLRRNLCDLVVYLNNQGSSFTRRCAEMDLEFVQLAALPFSVQLAENHPLLADRELDVEKLRRYPYVAFSDPENLEAKWTPWDRVVNPDKIICVQATNNRVELVAKTQAFSIVLPHSAAYNRAHGVVTIPLPGAVPIPLGYVFAKDRGLSAVGEDYVALFRRHLAFDGVGEPGGVEENQGFR